MLVFYQTREDGQQQWREGSEELLPKIKEEAYHLSIYALSQYPDDTIDDNQIKRSGDIVFDIDCKNPDGSPNLTEAIADANRLLNYFESINLPLDILDIYASGSKGFHIILPSKACGFPRVMTMLPVYHRFIAAAISTRAELTGWDSSLYNMGKGKLLRVANKKRTNGRYKVPVSASEIRTMTEESYHNITSTPREIPRAEKPRYDGNPELIELRIDAMNSLSKPKTPSVTLGAEQFEAFEGGYPPCIEQIIKAENIRPADGDFNSAKMSLARYIVTNDLSSSDRDYLISEFAENWESSKHKTKREREREVLSAFKSFEGKGFTCSIVVSAFDVKPCTGCKLYKPTREEKKKPSQSYSQFTLSEGEVSVEDGMYVKDFGKELKCISNFTLSPDAIFYDAADPNKIESFLFKVIVRGDAMTYPAFIGARQFVSRTEFKKAISGFGSAVFTGNDNDPGLIYTLITQPDKITGIKKMTQAQKVGICHHVAASRGIDERVWIQPGWSENDTGVNDTIIYRDLTERRGSDEYRLTIDLKGTNGKIDSISAEAFLALLNARDPVTSATFLGFMAACWIKPELQNDVFDHYFPILQIVGQAGSGKSSLVRYWSGIAGADAVKGGMIALSNITPAALRREGIKTTTVPRIIDECTKGKVSKDKWDHMRELIKSSATKQGVSWMGKKGDGSLYTEEIVCSSPLVTMGIDAPTEAEIEHRVVQIKLFASDTQHSPTHPYRVNFQFVKNNPEFLRVVAGAFMRRALKPDMDKIAIWQRSNNKITEQYLSVARKSLGAAIILTGLDFAEQIVKETASDNYNGPLLAKISNLREQYISDLEMKKDSVNVLADETSIFFEYLSLMVATYYASNGDFVLKERIHFFRTADVLYLRANAIYLPFAKYMREQRQAMEYQSAKSLENALISHRAFLGRGGDEGLPHGNDWIRLSVPYLVEGGLDVTRFDRK